VAEHAQVAQQRALACITVPDKPWTTVRFARSNRIAATEDAHARGACRDGGEVRLARVHAGKPIPLAQASISEG